MALSDDIKNTLLVTGTLAGVMGAGSAISKAPAVRKLVQGKKKQVMDEALAKSLYIKEVRDAGAKAGKIALASANNEENIQMDGREERILIGIMDGLNKEAGYTEMSKADYIMKEAGLVGALKRVGKKIYKKLKPKEKPIKSISAHDLPQHPGSSARDIHVRVMKENRY